jgi:hypothetical protein
MARSNSRTPRRVVSLLEGWRACERPRPRAWVMVSASWRAVCSNASAWSDGSSWSQWSASSRLWCHTRCAASNGPRWGECVDVGSEALLGASASGVGRSVLTTYRRCDAGGPRRCATPLECGGDPADWLDRAGIATSPVGLAGSREWDRLRTSTGIDRIAGAGARRRRPSGEGVGREAWRLFWLVSEEASSVCGGRSGPSTQTRRPHRVGVADAGRSCQCAVRARR